MSSVVYLKSWCTLKVDHNHTIEAAAANSTQLALYCCWGILKPMWKKKMIDKACLIWVIIFGTKFNDGILIISSKSLLQKSPSQENFWVEKCLKCKKYTIAKYVEMQIMNLVLFDHDKPWIELCVFKRLLFWDSILTINFHIRIKLYDKWMCSIWSLI